MNIEQFELILCDMYTMDAWSPPLLWKWKKEFKEASTKQWAIRELVESVLNWSVIISIIGVLVVLTNIVVQVLKKVTWDKLPTNALAMIVSLVLTLGAFFAYCSIKGIAVVWYMVFAAVVLAFMVAYAAMFGFDKLKEALGQIHK